MCSTIIVMSRRGTFDIEPLYDVLHADWEGVPLCGSFPEGAYLVDFAEYVSCKYCLSILKRVAVDESLEIH